ncbi:MAG: PIN domain-containing protein [Capsulimonadaceae bacterium]
MRLAAGLYQPKWTTQIHDEWMRNILKDRPDLSGAQLERTRDLMNRHGGDCIVTGYEHLIPSLSLPDPDDRHVLAAGITAKASLIVTFNLADFPDRALLPYGLRAIHPDVFASQLYAADSGVFVTLVRLHRMALRSPAKSPDEYLSTLRACGCTKTASLLQAHLGQI